VIVYSATNVRWFLGQTFGVLCNVSELLAYVRSLPSGSKFGQRMFGVVPL
jgi:hypothetical protein